MKLRQSYDCLIFVLRNPISGNMVFILIWGPDRSWSSVVNMVAADNLVM